MSGRGHSGGGAGGRGGGRGRGRGQGQGQGQHRGGGRSAGGRGGSAPYQPGPPTTRQPPSNVAPHPGFPSSSSIAGPSTGPTAASLAGEMERKMTIQTGLSQPPASQPGTPAQQPAPPSQEIQAPSQLPPSSSKSVRPPARPGFGTVGTKCVVRANHFLVNVVDKDLHHYDVTISPEVISKKVCRDIVNQLVTMYRASHLGNRQIAYDGSKSLYTPGALPFSSKEFVVKLVDNDVPSRREREFKVAIKFAAKAEIYQLQEFIRGRCLDSPQDTIQVLDVALRSRPSNKYSVVGRSFFHPSLGEGGNLGDGLEYWKGFYQSLRPTQMGLSLNIDVSARAFYEPILVTDFVGKYFNIRDITRPLSDQDRVKVKKAMKGVKVVVTHRQDVRKYKISGVSGIPTSQLTFTDDTGKKVSVVQYFKERYNTNIRFGSLPALQAGSDSKPVYLPMELCRIVDGQRYSKKLKEKQVTALLRATCQRPHDREASICKMVRQNDYNSDEVARGFGVNVGTELTSIQARVLPAPMIQYEGSQEAPRVGAWNMIDKRMFNGARVEFWTCVNFSRLRNNEASNFCDRLLDMCVRKGMDFSSTPLLPFSSAHPGQIEKTLSDIHSQSVERLRSLGHTGKHLQLLIIILPDVTGNYGKIKRVCETELGIVSQCCQPMQAVKCKEQYLENVALKINVKVGGRNSVLLNTAANLPFVTDTPTIIFGADVTHPQPGEDSSPSIAAVVASMDWPQVTKYRGLVSAQPHREEIIQDLYKTHEDPRRGKIHSGMIRELLIAHFRSTNRKPARIIFYRDGVSEGQFNQVLLHEMDAIRQACVSLEERYLPRVTFVVVQKRHHTRLFPAQHGDRRSTDRSGNILPGTVVDRQICHPSQFDFFLCSHAGIMGTSRPTHYHVLYDENGFNADALQILTNNLCYTYARCTRSVSIVPPAYYAHLAAFRARYYIEGDASDSGSTGGETSSRDRNVAVRQLPSIKENVKDVMFYC